MERNKIGNIWRTIGIIFAITSLVPLGLGFHKLFVYKNSEYYPSLNVNTYVGGDAYNYIINANYATAYFVLAGILILSAIGCGILMYLVKASYVIQPEHKATEYDKQIPNTVVDNT